MYLGNHFSFIKKLSSITVSASSHFYPHKSRSCRLVSEVLEAKCIGCSWTWEDYNNGGPLNAIPEAQCGLHKECGALWLFFNTFLLLLKWKFVMKSTVFLSSYAGNFLGFSKSAVLTLSGLCILTSWNSPLKSRSHEIH